jgi:hypothetical protein
MIASRLPNPSAAAVGCGRIRCTAPGAQITATDYVFQCERRDNFFALHITPSIMLEQARCDIVAGR